METITDMKQRHKNKIKALQSNCKHEYAIVKCFTSFEKRTECKNCGKILKRERG